MNYKKKCFVILLDKFILRVDEFHIFLIYTKFLQSYKKKMFSITFCKVFFIFFA